MATIAVGTDKGGYILRGGGDTWEAADPVFPGWQVTAWGRAADGQHLAATASGWFGPGLHASRDLVDWTALGDGPAFPDGGPEMQRIWSLVTAADGRIWCGVAEAGLFSSDDHGRTWQPLPSLNEHPTRDAWVPGAGGMCAHTILLDGDRMWVAASAIGVFRSDDAGATMVPHNTGLHETVPGGEEPPEVGYCVHRLTCDVDDPDRMWQQNHTGVFRSNDGARTWQRIEQGLPASFGFPIVRDHASGRLFLQPLTADVDRTPVDGDFAVWRSDDDGDSWHRSGTGWPDGPAYDMVLRGAMDGDGQGTVVAGTTGGRLWVTHDAGDSWASPDIALPRIHAVSILDEE